MKVYIASPFFNPEQLELVKEIETLLDRNSIDYFSPRSFGVIKDMTQEEKKNRMEEIYNSNISNIDNCNVMIAVVDWPDTGTMFELGYMAASCELDRTRKIITFTNKEKPVNVMLRYAIEAHASGIGMLSHNLVLLKKVGDVPEKFKNFPEVNT